MVVTIFSFVTQTSGKYQVQRASTWSHSFATLVGLPSGLWDCFGIALELFWNCFGIALELLWAAEFVTYFVYPCSPFSYTHSVSRVD